MVNLAGRSVLVDQSKSGAGDIVGFGGAPATYDSLGERRLAGAQIANEQHHAATRQLGGKVFAKCDRLLFRGGTIRRHTPPLPWEDIAEGPWPVDTCRPAPPPPVARPGRA